LRVKVRDGYPTPDAAEGSLGLITEEKLMLNIFLSYARGDGGDAVTRLRNELIRAGFNIWRDIEEMHGGERWKEQLRAALRRIDVVLVLLTPGAVESQMVAWEWENALTLEKCVIPLLAIKCKIPPELSQFHYHDLSEPENYSTSLMALMRDLSAASEAKRMKGKEVSITNPEVIVEGGFYQPSWNVGTVVQNAGEKESSKED
jgi:hypothetical protein